VTIHVLDPRAGVEDDDALFGRDLLSGEKFLQSRKTRSAFRRNEKAPCGPSTVAVHFAK
jgi:hypothetical protein